jgi:phage baseplate assembly protein W
MQIPIETKLPLNFSDKDGFYESITDFKTSIKQNLKCLFMTSKGERVRDTDFGIGIYDFVFENFDINEIHDGLASEIRRQVGKYTPYINIQELFIDYVETNKLLIRMSYNVPRIGMSDMLSLEV